MLLRLQQGCTRVVCSAGQETERQGARASGAVQPVSLSRRAALASGCAVLCLAAPRRAQAEAGVVVDRDVAGFGANPAREGDLLLVEFRGTLAASDVVFDSTLGGAPQRVNGDAFSVQPAPSVPRVVSLKASDAQPGICAGLRASLLGMRVGGERTVRFGSELGFGAADVRAPYALVPGGSELRYDVRLLRLSASGPDELMKGVSQCGIGGAGAQSAGCGAIEPSE